MRRIWTISLFLSSLLLLAAYSGVPAFAQGGGDPPTTIASQGFLLFTPYPAQEVAIGENATIDLTLRTSVSPQTVWLEAQDLPEGWTATFKGGSRVIEAAYVDQENDTKVNLRLDPPKDVAAGTYKLTVIGRGDNGQQVKLPLELIVKDKLPPSLDFSVDLPTLRGGPDTTFRYNVTLKNEGDAELSVNLVAETSSDFQTDFKLSGQDVTNIPIAANESKHLSIEVKAFSDIPAGDYPINILAQGGEVQAETTLTAEVTGQAQLSVTAPDGRLSAQAYVGKMTPLKIVVQNNGSASARNIALSANQPSGWKVEFDPKQITEVPAGKQVEVTANVQPADQAIAGDYVVTVQARPEGSSTKSADFRITVLTSTLWGVVGVGLIAVAVVVVGLAVSRFGRR